MKIFYNSYFSKSASGNIYNQRRLIIFRLTITHARENNIYKKKISGVFKCTHIFLFTINLTFNLLFFILEKKDSILYSNIITIFMYNNISIIFHIVRS